MFNLKGVRVRKALTAMVAAFAAALLLAPVASAIDKVDTSELREGVTVGGILEHERAFQNIANANDGNRAADTPGLRRIGASTWSSGCAARATA